MSSKQFKVALLLFWVVASKANDSDGNWKALSRIVHECVGQDEVSICFKMKAVNFLDRLVKAPESVPITEYISIESDPKSPPVQENEIGKDDPELTLPRGFEEKSQKLNDMIWSKIFTLATTKKIQYHLPTDLFEGRGKGKKEAKTMMMMMVAAGGMMMKMGMGMIGMIAGKAFLISKIALILAIIMLLKKSQGGGGSSHPQVVYAAAEHSGGGGGGGENEWQRRYHIDPQSLAYGA